MPDVADAAKARVAAREVVALSFEESIAELEKIVEEMERRDLPLEQALARYERGVHLSAHCKAKLDEAEARILKLTGEGKTEPFEPASEDSPF